MKSNKPDQPVWVVDRMEDFRYKLREIRESFAFQFTAVVLGMILLIIIIGVPVTYLIARPACFAATADIGHSNRWSFWAGCQIEVEPDTWIPLDNYQYIDGQAE